MNETKALTAFLLALFLGLAACSAAPAEEPPLAGAAIDGAFTLTGEDGRPVSHRDYAGKYRIHYFGFTHCPDICPTDLAAIGQAMTRFEEAAPDRAAKVQPIFITVDPERDTPDVMKRYSDAFHPRLAGLTGTPEQIAMIAKAHALYYAKEEPRPDGGYNVNHGRMAVLFSPEGEPMVLLPTDEGPEAVLAELQRWVR